MKVSASLVVGDSDEYRVGFETIETGFLSDKVFDYLQKEGIEIVEVLLDRVKGSDKTNIAVLSEISNIIFRLFKDNENVILYFFCDDLNEIITAAEKIHKDGVEVVAVSLGGDGAIVVSAEGVYRAIVPKIDAVNTVGCGDSMIAGFALGFSEGLSVAETLKKASAISAAAALREETGFFVMEDMKKIYEKVEIIKLK